MKKVKTLKVVSDFDGTLEKIIPLAKRLNGELTILTGRPPSERHLVEKALKNRGLKYKELINYPKEYNKDIGITLRSITRFKAKKLIELKADIFIDDDLKYVIRAKKLNPKIICLVVI
jgi:hypothetical protein